MDMTQQNSVFIDPEDCSSSVGYFVTTREDHNTKTDKTTPRISATVVLADCNHKIDWYFNGENKASIDKIDAAIKILREFRTIYVAECKRIARGIAGANKGE